MYVLGDPQEVRLQCEELCQSVVFFGLRDDSNDVVEVLVGSFELVDDRMLVRSDVVDLSHEVAEHLQEVYEGQQLDAQRIQRRSNAVSLLGLLDLRQRSVDDVFCFHGSLNIELHDADVAENRAQLRPHELGFEVWRTGGSVEEEVLGKRVDEVGDVLLFSGGEEKVDEVAVVLDLFVD